MAKKFEKPTEKCFFESYFGVLTPVFVNDRIFSFALQLTALAMLLLDPYYRTIEGFEVLINYISVEYHESVSSTLLSYIHGLGGWGVIMD